MNTKEVKFSEVLPNEAFLWSGVSAGCLCFRLSEDFFRFPQDPKLVNTVVISCDDSAGITLIHTDDGQTVSVINMFDRPLVSVMEEIRRGVEAVEAGA